MNLMVSPIKMNTSNNRKINIRQNNSSCLLEKTKSVSFKSHDSQIHMETEDVFDIDKAYFKDDYLKLALKCSKEEKDMLAFSKELMLFMNNNLKKFPSQVKNIQSLINYISENENIELLSEFLEKNAHMYKTDNFNNLAENFYLKKTNRASWLKPFSTKSSNFGFFSRYSAEYVNRFLDESNKIKIQKIKEKEKETNDKILLLRKINNAKETLSFDFIEKIMLVKSFQNDEDIENQKIRNSILIEHSDEKIRKNLINWLLDVSDCNKLAVKNNESLSLDAFVKKLKTALELCEKIYKEKGIPSLVYVDDMENFISKDIPRLKRGAMKSLLQDCYKKYHSTLIFDTNNSKNIDNTSMQPHRTLHIDILNDPIIERIKQSQSETKLNPNLDGYRMTYGTNPNNFVDLFLGCFGHSKEILWLDTNDKTKINIVLDKLDVIKRNEKFSQIKKLQCPCADDELPGFYRLNDKTVSGEYIYEKNV